MAAGLVVSLVAAAVATAIGGAVTAITARQNAKATKAAASAQAAELKQQADLKQAQAGIAQRQGEEAEAKRMRQLANDIGSTYANFAGNGLLVDSKGGTIASVLKTQTEEGLSDVATIKDNTAMNVWTYQQNAANLRASAKNTWEQGKATARNQMFQARLGLAQTITGLPLVSSGGFNSAAGSLSGMKSSGTAANSGTSLGTFVDNTQSLQRSNTYISSGFGGSAKV